MSWDFKNIKQNVEVSGISITLGISTHPELSVDIRCEYSLVLVCNNSNFTVWWHSAAFGKNCFHNGNVSFHLETLKEFQICLRFVARHWVDKPLYLLLRLLKDKGTRKMKNLVWYTDSVKNNRNEELWILCGTRTRLETNSPIAELSGT